MPPLDLPSAIAASTSRSRGVSSRAVRSPRRRPEHPADDLGVERAAAGGHALHGVDERRHVADPLLEQVADPLGTVADQVQRVALLVELREHEDAGVRQLGRAAPSPRAGRRPRGAAASGRRRRRRRGGAPASCAGSPRRRPDCATTSNPASASSRAMPSRRRTSSSPITMRSSSGTGQPYSVGFPTSRRASSAMTRSAARSLAMKPTAPKLRTASVRSRVWIRRGDHDTRAPRQRGEVLGERDPVAVGQPDVDEHGVGPQLGCRRCARRARACLADDLQAHGGEHRCWRGRGTRRRRPRSAPCKASR